MFFIAQNIAYFICLVHLCLHFLAMAPTPKSLRYAISYDFLLFRMIVSVDVENVMKNLPTILD